ncbi:hypothetical protein [Blastococcus mobilis]|uniref:hypothetical protein n=1 Tax=Blastococcus mobilis TaxID=1938746 RepID=UPI001595FAE3|nr:hypothetical protein [Blastococcus mobilis]
MPYPAEFRRDVIAVARKGWRRSLADREGSSPGRPAVTAAVGEQSPGVNVDHALGRR